MKTVKLNKNDLRNALIRNQRTHLADYQIAIEAYQKELVHKLEDKLDEAKAWEPGQPGEWAVYLAMPENHSDDYQRAIEMLDWEIDNHVELTEAEFQQFVQDKWQWKAQFVHSNMLYTGSASPSSL